jgi:hypothetical protein
MSSFPDKDRASYLCPFIHPHRRSLRELHLHLELRPALASLQPPFPQPQQPSHPRLFRASQQHQLRPQQQRPLRLLLRGDPQRPFRPLPG